MSRRKLAWDLPPEFGVDKPLTTVVDEIVPLVTAELRYLQWALAHHKGDRKVLAAQRLSASAPLIANWPFELGRIRP